MIWSRTGLPSSITEGNRSDSQACSLVNSSGAVSISWPAWPISVGMTSTISNTNSSSATSVITTTAIVRLSPMRCSRSAMGSRM